MIADLLKEMREQGIGQVGFLSRRVLSTSPFDAFVGLRTPANLPVLQVRFEESLVVGKVRAVKNRGFEVRTERVPNSSPPRSAITIDLLETRDETVFVTFAEDVISRLGECDSEGQAAKRLSDALAVWQHFFERRALEGLSEQRQTGLFGEIWFLLERLLPAMGPKAALAAWTGPKGTNQDFERRGYAIEVKTTAQTPLSEVRISNLRQLDDAVLDGLLLVVIEVERHDNTTETLVEIVERGREVLGELGSQFCVSFNDGLIMAGYLDAHASNYLNPGYRVRDDSAFRVSLGFPRIVQGDVPEGIGDVRYAIERSALAAYRAPVEDVSRFVEEMARVE